MSTRESESSENIINVPVEDLVEIEDNNYSLWLILLLFILMILYCYWYIRRRNRSDDENLPGENAQTFQTKFLPSPTNNEYTAIDMSKAPKVKSSHSSSTVSNISLSTISTEKKPLLQNIPVIIQINQEDPPKLSGIQFKVRCEKLPRLDNRLNGNRCDPYFQIFRDNEMLYESEWIDDDITPVFKKSSIHSLC